MTPFFMAKRPRRYTMRVMVEMVLIVVILAIAEGFNKHLKTTRNGEIPDVLGMIPFLGLFGVFVSDVDPFFYGECVLLVGCIVAEVVSFVMILSKRRRV